MLKKLLPILTKLKSLLPGRKSPKSESGQIYSLVEEIPSDSIYTHSNKIKVLMALICFFFLFLLAANWFFDRQLDKLLVVRNDYIARIKVFDRTVQLVESVNKKIDFIKRTRTGRVSLKTKTEYVVTNVVSPIVLQEVSVDPHEFSAKLSGKSLVDFSQQLAKYLSGNVVTQLSIKTADYNAYDNEYTVVLGGKFK